MLKRQKVAIVANQRSGTHALGAVLQRNGFANLGEIFHAKCYDGEHLIKYARFQHYLNELELRGIDPLAVLPVYMDYVENLTQGSTYIDLKYNTLALDGAGLDLSGPMPAPLALCASRGYVFVHLVRQNTLHQYVSEMVAGATGQYGVLNGQQPKRVALRLDPKETVAEVARRQRVADTFATWLSDYPTCTLHYEKAFADDNLTSGAIEALDEIGIAIKNPETYWRKQGADMRETIANYDVIATALRQASLGHTL